MAKSDTISSMSNYMHIHTDFNDRPTPTWTTTASSGDDATVNIPSVFDFHPVMSTTRLKRGEPGHAELMERCAKRIKAMSERLNGNADALYHGVWTAFAQDMPLTALWAVRHGDDLVGHLLADIRQVNGEWICYIIQEEVSRSAIVNQDLVDTTIHELEDWVRTMRKAMNVPITRLMMETYRPSSAWIKRYGFIEHSTIYQRRIA